MTAGVTECWCCGQPQDAGAVVRLGHRPEVALCPRCAYQTARRARVVERAASAGRWPRLRDAAVRAVIARGLDQHAVLGRPLRWLGRRIG